MRLIFERSWRITSQRRFYGRREFNMLTPWRNHLKSCPHRDKGRAAVKCSCPVWADGTLYGRRYRKSLGTRDWARAIRRMAEIEDPKAPRLKPLAEAVTAYLSHIQSLEPSTQRKHKNVLRHLSDFSKAKGLHDVADITLDMLDSYRAGRRIARNTAQKELETLRQFFGFCFDRKWTDENPAKKIKSAKNIKPSEVVPYTPDEVTRIIAACDAIGRGPYERLRARAMVLLLNNTALRISDVATFERSRVHGGRLLVRTTKNGDMVYLPLWAETQKALDRVPPPRAGKSQRYYFWNEASSRRTVVSIAERTLRAVFKESKVENAHAHRFRHTLATRLLGMGASVQEVADILGNSPAIVLKHYAKWSQARQKRISELMTLAQSKPGVAADAVASDQIM
jgi:integrase/recombinase XerC